MGLFDRIADKISDAFSDDSSPHPEPMVRLSGNWRLHHGVSDEFASNLDLNKWEPFNRNWKGRAPGWFNPANVTVEGECLNLRSKFEQPPSGYPPQFHTYSTAFIRSKQQVRYGYIEAMVHPADSVTSSAFWLVHNTKQTWNEIDVFELSQGKNQGSKYHMNMHLFRVNGKKLPKTLSKPRWHPLQFNSCEKPFVASLLWEPDFITWYVEGLPVRRERNEYWHEPMWVQFDSETMPRWFGLPPEGDYKLPATFKVLHVRCWQRA